MVGNAVVTRNANGDIQPDKAKARGKIDGISAAVTAMTLIVGEESGGGSYLDEAEEMVVLR
jgi:phage terminase large subunit-like protein